MTFERPAGPKFTLENGLSRALTRPRATHEQSRRGRLRCKSAQQCTRPSASDRPRASLRRQICESRRNHNSVASLTNPSQPVTIAGPAARRLVTPARSVRAGRPDRSFPAGRPVRRRASFVVAVRPPNVVVTNLTGPSCADVYDAVIASPSPPGTAAASTLL